MLAQWFSFSFDTAFHNQALIHVQVCASLIKACKLGVTMSFSKGENTSPNSDVLPSYRMIASSLEAEDVPSSVCCGMCGLQVLFDLEIQYQQDTDMISVSTGCDWF